MKNFIKNAECKQGLAVFFFGLLFLAIAPWQIPDAKARWGIIHALPGGHKMFPYMSIIFIMVGGVMLWLDGCQKPAKTAPKEDHLDYVGFWVSIFVWAAYTVMVMYIGYIVSTVIVLVFLLRYYGLKSWLMTASITVGATAFVYIIFVMLMKIPFPRTALFF